MLDLSEDEGDEVYIKTTSLIDIDNYYTKDEIDNIVQHINSSIVEINEHIDIIDASVLDISTRVDNLKTNIIERLDDVDSSIVEVRDILTHGVVADVSALSLSDYVSADAVKDDNGVVTITMDASVLDSYDMDAIHENDESALITNKYLENRISWVEVEDDDD